MSKKSNAQPTRTKPIALAVCAGAIVLGSWALYRSSNKQRTDSASTGTDGGKTEPMTLSDSDVERIKVTCSHCHEMVSPDVFPRSAWRKEMVTAYGFVRKSDLPADKIAPFEQSLKYFEDLAPERFPLPDLASQPEPDSKLTFVKRPYDPDIDRWDEPAVTHVNWVHLTSETRPDCLVCDGLNGGVLLWRHDNSGDELELLKRLKAPGHAEVVDLDQDGHLDIVVAELGQIKPTDERVGSVEWLRQDVSTQKFQRFTLAENLGRVADVQAADFDSDGDVDLIVAEFGWKDVGDLHYFENQGIEDGVPQFESTIIDDRTGTIRIEIVDIDRDGHLDFVALLTQEHEQVVAFLNDGTGDFTAEVIFDAHNCAYGCGGMTLADLDEDGDLDVLLSNGDTLDMGIYKPYNSAQWLENRGSFPFTHHHLMELQGAYGADIGDFDGDGDQDIIAVSFLPAGLKPDAHSANHEQVALPETLRLPSIVWLEQTGPGQFEPHTLETASCCHPTVAVTDFDGDGDPDVVIPNCTFQDNPQFPGAAGFPKSRNWITIWENQTPKAQTATRENARSQLGAR